MPMPLRKLPEAFGLHASKSWFPHYFNTKTNLDYVGPIPNTKFYGADAMSGGGRGGNSSPGMIRRKSRSSITGTCYNNTVKLTSSYCVRHVAYSDENF